MTDRPPQPEPWLRPLRDELVEAALFGALGSGGDATLAPLEEFVTGGPLPGVPGPRVRSDLAEELPARIGRYQLIGEIARGGMGVVVRGRDLDLGRDLAVKVLLEGHSGDPGMVRRFVEEAQIGGQLQHPGDRARSTSWAVLADARPYFAMKLVKGRTLAALLDGRADPAEDAAAVPARSSSRSARRWPTPTPAA